MTITTTTSTRSFSGDASTTVFAYNYKILDDDEIQVIIRAATGAETVKEKGTHYTVSGVGVPSGGNITFGTAPANTETVVLRRSTPQTQSVDLVENDPFTAETVEGAFDRSVILAQELQEQVDRSIKISRTNTMTSTEFTNNATSRANKILSFDASGELSIAQELGTFKGNSATITTAAFNVRDIVKATTTEQLNNIYICVGASAIGDVLTDTDHWALIVDAVTAAASATTATTKASEAASSASAASASASAASASETAAETAETAAVVAQNAAVAAFDSFDDVYLGSKSSAPSVDNDGDALADGALYWNISSNRMFVWNGSAFVVISPTSTEQGHINTVSGIAANVTTVAGVSADVTSVAGVSANVTTVAGISANVTTVAGVSADVTTVAANVAGVTSFAERYRVAGSAPSSSLDVGDLYFDTSSDTMKVYGGSGWQNAGSSVNGTSARFIFSVSSSTLTISGNDTAGNTLAYDAGFVDVWLNGVKMVNGTDVTVTSGTSIVFAVAIGTSGTDTVDVIAYGTFNVANVTSSSLENGSVTTAKIADDAVTVDKLANTINAEITANTAKVTNATHTGEVTGATELTIADNVVDEANLKVSNAPTNGYFLSAQSGDTGGLTWAEVAGGFSFNAVTGATPSLNVGSYNFFDNGTLAANTTVSFASVPTEANWKYTFEVGNNTIAAWDISNASYVRAFSVAAQDTQPQDLFFKPDGTEMYVLGDNNDGVNQYTLSTAWDISSASYTRAFSVNSQETYAYGLAFKSDGTEMYICGLSGIDVNQYTLSTAWNISTASYTRAFSVAGQETSPNSLFFKPDGTEMYVTGNTGDDVNQYTLSTAWNISTASYTRVFSVAAQETYPMGLTFKPDGTEMYICGQTGQDVNQYTLSTGWDISTATYTRVFSVAGQELYPYGLTFKPDGTEMYICGLAGQDVNQYALKTPYTVTLPAAIENPPTEPLVIGSRYTYDFFTEDSGTTVTLLSENKE
jgi:hypothetical protein